MKGECLNVSHFVDYGVLTAAVQRKYEYLRRMWNQEQEENNEDNEDWEEMKETTRKKKYRQRRKRVGHFQIYTQL